MDRYVPLPPLPGRVGRLNELAYDLWWSWNAPAREVFRELDYPLWRFTDHNPVLLLHLVEPELLEHAASDPEFLRLYDEAVAGLDLARVGGGTWWSRVAASAGPIALVTPAFALHQSLPTDTAASGVLAGDYCKEASDLGVPLVGVGLMYSRGYAHQRLSADGWQQEEIEYLDWSDAPIGPALLGDGSRCGFTLALGGAEVHVLVWQVRMGRAVLYLLDTDVPENKAWDRELSSGSFGDDSQARIAQAALLGAGAVRALDLLGVEPAMWHLAESAASFVTLERLHRALVSGVPFDDALAAVRATTMFCTREASPPRGDRFTFAAVDRQMSPLWSFGEHHNSVLALGRYDTDRAASFNLCVLGAHASGILNVATSAAPARTREEWWQAHTDDPEGRRTVHSIAEGVHASSWISADLSRLFDEYVGDDWRDRQDDPAAWQAVMSMPDAELWSVRQRLRGCLVDFMRERARRRWGQERATGARLVALGTLLDGTALTIGFGRRAAASARPDLIFHDAERLARIVTAARRPVQIVFAGKAQPGDDLGKHHLQRVFQQALDPMYGGRVAFLEDYDLHVARLLVQGCDVWLSTPTRGGPTAIGGIKAAINGVPHLATPGAWWVDGYTGTNGWVIDGGSAPDPAAQDAADARALYTIIEDEIVPAFYDRDRGASPARWLAIMKEAISTTLPRFCARRSMKAFADAAYGAAVVRS